MSIVGKTVEFVFFDGDRIQGKVLDLLPGADNGSGSVIVQLDDGSGSCQVVSLYQFYADHERHQGTMRILGGPASCR